MRGVDATVKFATAAPDGVKRSSGSAVRFPTTVMVVSPATSSSWIWRCARSQSQASLRKHYDEHTPFRLVLVGPQHLGPQHRLVQVELTVEFGHGRGLRLHIDDVVDALGMLGDLVRQPALAPDVDLVDTAAVLADDVEECLQRRSYGALVESGVENDHDFVWTHKEPITSYGLVRPRSFRGRRVACVGNRPRLQEQPLICEIALLVGQALPRSGVIIC